MTRTLRWARARRRNAPGIRRGAWYPVVADGPNANIVLCIGTRYLTVPRNAVLLREDSPHGFSVVVRSAKDPNPVRGTTSDLGLTYAVCPWSRSRIPLEGHPERLECPDCGHRDTVAWEDIC